MPHAMAGGILKQKVRELRYRLQEIWHEFGSSLHVYIYTSCATLHCADHLDMCIFSDSTFSLLVHQKEYPILNCTKN